MNKLLIIDADADLNTLLCHHFEGEGYATASAATGEDGLALAVSARPNLILLSAQMPDMEGMAIFRALRDKPRTAHIPVMMLAGKHEAMLQNKILEEGVYDVIEKPVDVDILALRVRNTLRRAEREGLTESRTGLPSGRLLLERLRALENEEGWYKITLRIDHFNVFRDLYGFVTANEALRFAANLITQIVGESGNPDDFVGHVTNSEEFIIITTPARGPAVRDALRQRITPELESFYNFMERDQGYVLVEDGAGGTTQKPLMTAQISVNVRTGPDDDVWVDAEDETPPPPVADSPFTW